MISGDKERYSVFSPLKVFCSIIELSLVMVFFIPV